MFKKVLLVEKWLVIHLRGNLCEVAPDGTVVMAEAHGDWDINHGPQVVERVTSDTSSIEDVDELPSLPRSDDIDDSLATAPIVLANFDEQMMLAMAVSLAEAQAMSSGPGASWQ